MQKLLVAKITKSAKLAVVEKGVFDGCGLIFSLTKSRFSDVTDIVFIESD